MDFGLITQESPAFRHGECQIGINECVGKRYESRHYTKTASACAAEVLEIDFSAYELICTSGTLSFWDKPEEDIYSFEDGEAL